MNEWKHTVSNLMFYAQSTSKWLHKKGQKEKQKKREKKNQLLSRLQKTEVYLIRHDNEKLRTSEQIQQGLGEEQRKDTYLYIIMLVVELADCGTLNWRHGSGFRIKLLSDDNQVYGQRIAKKVSYSAQFSTVRFEIWNWDYSGSKLSWQEK